MSAFTPRMKAYSSVTGAPVAAADMLTGAGTTNEVRYATQRVWGQVLNGFDYLNFTLSLDDPMAKKMVELKTTVKLWVDWLDPDDASRFFFAPNDTPHYCGVVINTRKDGQQGTMSISTISVLWKVSCHFHIENHRLITDPETGLPWEKSGLMWKIIELVTGAFGSTSKMGIEKGSLFRTSQLSPYFIAQGSNAWANVSDDVMNHPDSPDIVPEYLHADNDPIVMAFTTDEWRGIDRSSGVKFEFYTGSHNCDDLTEEVSVQPGKFGNYVWAVGQGTAYSNKIGVAQVVNAGQWAWNDVGVYMVQVPHPEMKRRVDLHRIAESELDKSNEPIRVYTVKLNPAIQPNLLIDYELGDIVTLHANRGALNVNAKQRIYEVHTAFTENNNAVCDLRLAKDFKAKVPEL